MSHFLSHKLNWHRIFFVFFLFSLPFSIRKVFVVFSPDGIFNEYLDVSLYLSDILIVLTLLLFILHNKRYILSISYWRRMFHVEHLLLPIFIPIFFIFWSGLSLYWSKNLILAIFSFVHLLELYFLYLYILLSNVPRGTLDTSNTRNCSTWNNKKSSNRELFHVEQLNNNKINVPRGTFWSFLSHCTHICSTWNIYQLILFVWITSGFLQSFIAILQFIENKSLGLSILKESVLSPLNPGVAKIIINGEAFIRAYGFFPHPNILGAFLAISLLMTIFYPLIYTFKLFHVEQSTSIYLYRSIIFIQSLGLLLTFSKTALTGFIIGLIISIFSIKRLFHVEQSNNKEDVPRGTIEELISAYIKKCSTWNICNIYLRKIHNMFHVEHMLIIFTVILTFGAFFFINLKYFIIQPFTERLFYMKPLSILIKEYPLGGLGIGQFVYRMQDFFNEPLLTWQFQPIHNVFLLIFSEGGFIGLGLFIWLFWYVYLKNKRKLNLITSGTEKIYVPRGTISESNRDNIQNCSTWNILYPKNGRRIMQTLLMRSLLVVILFSMFFDHYLWDIQQGQLILWILLALALSREEY